MPEDQRNELWDDGLHFIDEGYNHVGQLVGKHLIDILKRADETPLLGENENWPEGMEHAVKKTILTVW